jgi:predicted permease
MENLLQDLRFALRMLIKKPAFTAVAIFSLALGIGANTAVFTLVNAVLFKKLPVSHPEQLVAVYTTRPESRLPDNFSYLDYRDYRDKNEVFSALMVHSGIPLSMSRQEGQPELIWAELVSANYFSGLGVNPYSGRGFLPEEDQKPGGAPVVVASYRFWKQQLGSDPNVVGKSLRLNGHEFTVVGIAPFGFSGTKFLGFIPDVWVPIMMQAQVMPASGGLLNDRGSHWLSIRGRLKPHVSLQQAEAAMNVVARQLAQTYPQTDKDYSIHLIPGSTKTEPFLVVMGFIPIVAALMMGVVGLVLLIACANVANLLLARATARRREIAVRLAIGANRLRLIRQLLTESLLLSLLSGGFGLGLAFWFNELFKLGAPVLDFPTIDFDYSLSPDHRILGFTLVISILTGIIFGVLPAFQASKTDVVSTMKGEESTVGAGTRRFTLRNLLVVSQVALSLMLLISAALFLQSAFNAQKLNPGFETRNILLASVDVGLQGYTEEKGRNFYKQVVERVEMLPGVKSASLAFPLPLDAYNSSVGVMVEGYALRSEQDRIHAGLSLVGNHYFTTMDTPLLEGRGFDERDTSSSPNVVIINETLAHRYWQGQDPIGKRLKIGSEHAPFLEVVGVAQDGKYITLGEPPMNYIFLPLSQNYDGRTTLIVRTSGNPKSLAAMVRNEVQKLDDQLPLFGIKTMREFLERLLSGPESIAGMVMVFGIIALLLAVIGIYGVMSYSVIQRTHEIGIRIAIGAERRDILKLVVGQGMGLSLIGVFLGLGGAMALTRVTSSLLYGIDAANPLTFVAASLVLTLVALLTCFLPARRASQVDPMVALRYE